MSGVVRWRCGSILLPLLLSGLHPTPAPPRWSGANADQLLDAIEAARDEGIDPDRYDPDGLRRLIVNGPGADLDDAASRRFMQLARDYAGGTVPRWARTGWHFPPTEPGAIEAEAQMQRALDTGHIAGTLSGLLPVDPRYGRLRDALRATPVADLARRDLIVVNMERWRWLPRTEESPRIEVNVPAASLDIIANGAGTARHDIIVGKPATPTPQFRAMAQAVILNPWWEVPTSIVEESVGAFIRRNPQQAGERGFVWTGGQVRQRPGPDNALGEIKVLMPNRFRVYIHDTPDRTLFAGQNRALSHGCIRVADPRGMATALLAGPRRIDREEIDRIIASGETRRIDLDPPMPVHVLYFTAEVGADGQLLVFPDIYGRDATLRARIATRLASSGDPLSARATGSRRQIAANASPANAMTC